MRLKQSWLSFALFFCAFTYAVPAEKPTIKIGAVIPLSGSNSAIGEDIRDGLLLARQLNKQDKYNYELIFEDSRFELRQAAVVAQTSLYFVLADGR